MRAHLEGAARALRDATPPGLTDEALARRAALLGHLRRYIDDERYPINRVRREPTPVFVDELGSRCAVAALLEATGRHDVVARVARTANLARVHELAGDGEFVGWLDRHGLTLDEAARVQPSYSEHMEAHWQPTASVYASAQVGVGASPGAEVTLSPGLRVGARRVLRGSDGSGSPRYGSVAFTLEYARAFVVDVGSANQLSLTLQWEPESNHSDGQWYLLGGALLALDEDNAPGDGVGAQLGAGFSFRRRALPLFAEGVVQGLAQHGAALRLGVQVGLVW
ncbi:MAG: hypothetical protein U0325_36300 [Polyangiales bacterium]